MTIDLRQQRVEYGRQLGDTLKRIGDQLAAMPEVKRVILFGSYAAGRRDLLTDLDLVVVMESERGFVQRTAELYQQLSVGVDLDLLVYTPEEFEASKENGFLRRAIETGRVIYEKERP